MARAQCSTALCGSGERGKIAGLSWCQVSSRQRSVRFGEMRALLLQKIVLMMRRVVLAIE